MEACLAVSTPTEQQFPTGLLATAFARMHTCNSMGYSAEYNVVGAIRPKASSTASLEGSRPTLTCIGLSQYPMIP